MRAQPSEPGEVLLDEVTRAGAEVELRGVNKYFGKLQVLRDIDLTIRPGEVVAVIGPSGSGKSTLCRTINGLETVDSGAVLIDGKPLPLEARDLAHVRTQIGMVFQSFNLFAHMSVLSNLTLGPVRVQNVPKARAQVMARRLLDGMGIGDKADSLPVQLSGGQQQRAAIARALIMQPKIMLCDEPTSALDPEMIREVLDVLRRLALSGMTMIVVTHEMGFAASAAKRVIFMSEGRIVEDAPSAEFFQSPKSDRAQAFLSAVLHH